MKQIAFQHLWKKKKKKKKIFLVRFFFSVQSIHDISHTNYSRFLELTTWTKYLLSCYPNTCLQRLLFFAHSAAFPQLQRGLVAGINIFQGLGPLPGKPPHSIGYHQQITKRNETIEKLINGEWWNKYVEGGGGGLFGTREYLCIFQPIWGEKVEMTKGLHVTGLSISKSLIALDGS